MTQETCLSIAGVHNENVLAGTTLVVLVVKLEPHSTLHTINIYYSHYRRYTQSSSISHLQQYALVVHANVLSIV